MSDNIEDKKSTVDTLAAAPQESVESSASSDDINRIGPQFVHYLFSASKTVQVHDLNNRATQRVLSELMKPLQELFGLGDTARLFVSMDYLHINDVRVSVDPQNFGPFLYVIEEMKSRDVEAIEVSAGVDADEIGRFLKIFFSEPPDGDVYNNLVGHLEQANITNIRITQHVERERQLEDSRKYKKDIREESNRVFFRTVLLMRDVLRGIEQKRVIEVRKAARLTQQMVDIIQTDETILVGLASIKKFDEYTFAHSVNVCILSMIMGDRLRLYKSDIAHLGVAALLHDIGKTYIPQTILNKPGRLEDKDWELMKYHTFFGVKELSRIKSLREVADALFVSLQHHVHFNMDGYPQKPSEWDLRLFTRIVTIADYYDAMTTPRIYATEPLTPDKALRFILQKSGEIFDPFITKVFIQAMGIYPIGTVVELDTGERGVVVRQNQASRFVHRPLVSLLDSDGNYDPDSEPVDLSEPSSSGNGFTRTVVKAFYSESSEHQKSKHFVNG